MAFCGCPSSVGLNKSPLYSFVTTSAGPEEFHWNFCPLLKKTKIPSIGERLGVGLAGWGMDPVGESSTTLMLAREAGAIDKPCLWLRASILPSLEHHEHGLLLELRMLLVLCIGSQSNSRLTIPISGTSIFISWNSFILLCWFIPCYVSYISYYFIVVILV